MSERERISPNKKKKHHMERKRETDKKKKITKTITYRGASILTRNIYDLR